MADNKMNIVDEVFQVPVSIVENGVIEKTLKTKDTYVDKDIHIKIETPDASFEQKDKGAGANGEISATVSTTDTTYTSDTETPYAITIAADAHVNAVTVGVENAGFAAATDEITLEAADASQDTKTIYIKEGTLGGTGSASATSSSVKLTASNENATGFVIKASGAGNVGVATAGWVDPDKTAAVETDGDAYYTVQAATLSNSEVNADNFTEVTAPVLTEDGYLFINEGYIEDTKISLATLVPDGSTLGTVTEASQYMYNTIKAYDNDGKLVTGTMGNAELGAITANDASATVGTVSVAYEDGAFKVSGQANIAGTTSVAVSKRGLAETTLTQAGVISGTADVDATLATVGLGVDLGEDVVVTPVIAKEDATTAASGDITTTAPANGYYVAVSTAAIEETVEATPSVTSAGYGNADHFTATGDSVTVGAAASGTYYIPITAAVHTDTENDSTVVAPVTTVSTSFDQGDVTPVTYAEGAKVAGQQYVRVDALAQTADGSVQTSANCTVTEGYTSAIDHDFIITEAVEVADANATAAYIKVYDGTIIG